MVGLTAEPPVFGGRWIYAVEPRGDGAALTITERGWVDPPLFRAVMVLGGLYDDTVRAHAAALKDHLER